MGLSKIMESVDVWRDERVDGVSGRLHLLSHFLLTHFSFIISCNTLLLSGVDLHNAAATCPAPVNVSDGSSCFVFQIEKLWNEKEKLMIILEQQGRRRRGKVKGEHEMLVEELRTEVIGGDRNFRKYKELKSLTVMELTKLFGEYLHLIDLYHSSPKKCIPLPAETKDENSDSMPLSFAEMNSGSEEITNPTPFAVLPSRTKVSSPHPLSREKRPFTPTHAPSIIPVVQLSLRQKKALLNKQHATLLTQSRGSVQRFEEDVINKEEQGEMMKTREVHLDEMFEWRRRLGCNSLHFSSASSGMLRLWWELTNCTDGWRWKSGRRWNLYFGRP
jgi:hypothetical protein